MPGVGVRRERASGECNLNVGVELLFEAWPQKTSTGKIQKVELRKVVAKL